MSRRRRTDRARFAGPVALAVSVLAACGGSADEASHIPREGAASTGRLVIVGGALDEGLGFFDGGVLDQHFLARGRIGRLLVTVLEHPEISVAFGIDENTAMVVDGDRATVVGESGVVVVDGRSARSATDDGARALRVTLVGSGDRVDLGTLDVTTGSGKTPLQPAETGIPSSGVFERWTFLHALVGLAGSSETGVTYDLAGADLRLAEGVGFRAVALSGGEGPEGTPRGFSAGPYEVTLAPTR